MMWPVTIGIIVIFLILAGMASVAISKKQELRERYLSVIARTGGGHDKEDGKDKNLAKQRADIAKKLNEAGVDAFVLKYRLIHTGAGADKDEPAKAGPQRSPRPTTASSIISTTR